MRLLDTLTGQFLEKDPRDEDTVYAILSHTWDPVAGEQSFKDLKKIQKCYVPRPRRLLLLRPRWLTPLSLPSS